MSHSDYSLISNPRKRSTGSRLFTIACTCVAAFATVGIFLSLFWSQTVSRPASTEIDHSAGISHPPSPPLVEPSDLYDPAKVVRGPPTAKFRDNLYPEKKYITSWISAGWTNDVMTYINLIYLGMITERIPIIPMFVPSHIGNLDTVPTIPMSEIFDLPRLRRETRTPIVEWKDVKHVNSTEVEELGCWNTWEAVQKNEERPRWSVVPRLLSLDLSYTKAPSWLKLIPNYVHDQHMTFWSLAALAFPEYRKENLAMPRESELNKVRLPPDEHVLCYDYLYYVCAHQPFEYDFDFSPAWRFVGQHLHWSDKINGLVDQYVRRTIGVPEDEKTPAWIAIHIRHGDFADWCGTTPVDECFASLKVISRRVEEVRQELRERKGIDVKHVIMTSDERNATWWDGVKALGYYQVDHSQTVEKYGRWYPVLIDAGIQSSGVGFVGTDRSTMSILARRRVLSWADGAARIIKWGKPDTDDH